jgi:uridine kinase
LAAVIAAVSLKHPTRVGIDGVDAAGKTSLADELVEPLERRGRHVVRASVDGFHYPREVRYRRGSDSVEGYFLDSFDYPTLKSELLDPLAPEGTRRFRRAAFDYRTDRPVETPDETANANTILLFDGVFLQRPELVGSWDVRIWVEAPFDVTVPRAVRRDAGATVEAEILARYRGRYVPGQLMYMERCSPQDAADILVDNADLGNPRLRYRRFGRQ